MVRGAKAEGLPVTCDVAVHHLHLCDVDIGWFDAQCRLIPPLRSTRDRAALRAGLADGTIDLVSTDHAKLRHVIALLTPGLVYASDLRRFAKAIAAAATDDNRAALGKKRGGRKLALDIRNRVLAESAK